MRCSPNPQAGVRDDEGLALLVIHLTMSLVSFVLSMFLEPAFYSVMSTDEHVAWYTICALAVLERVSPLPLWLFRLFISHTQSRIPSYSVFAVIVLVDGQAHEGRLQEVP